MRFAFLDQSTPARRRDACAEEVRVNQPLAADVYLGVRALVADGGRVVLAPAGAAPADALDWVVEMRRFREDDTLDARVRAGTATDADVAGVAAAMARLHEASPPATAGGCDDVLAAWNRNAEQLAAVAGAEPEAARLAVFGSAWALRRRELLDGRAADGRVRDGHGDLRAEHVLLEPRGVRVVDRIEFDASLRTIDVAADLAFLIMDLHRLGAADLARALPGAYRAAGGDPGPPALLAFHAAQRAMVRAKVAHLRARQEPAGGALAEARALLRLAARFAWAAREPGVLVVCGPAASGKSTVAQALGERAGLPVLASDIVRKRLAGLDPAQRGGPELYDETTDRRTYAELARLASLAAAEGGAIVDATFRRAAGRRALVDALGPGVAARFVECRTPAAVAARWATEREADPRRVSDAGAAVAARHRAEFEPLDDVAPGRHLSVRTDAGADHVVRLVEAWLDA